MEYVFMVLLMCTGVLTAPTVFVLQPLLIGRDTQLQGDGHVLLAAPADGQLLMVPSQKSQGVEDYDEGVEDSKDWKEEEEKVEGKEDYDNGQYDPKKYEDASETEKSEITEDYNEKVEDEQTEEYNEKSQEENTTGSEVETTMNEGKVNDSGKYEPGKYEEQGEDSGKYDPSKDEEQENNSGKYHPTKFEENSEDSGKYDAAKYEGKDDESEKWSNYNQNDSGQYVPAKYEENSLEASGIHGQYIAGNFENREGKTSQAILINNGPEQKTVNDDEERKAKDAESKRETVEGSAESSEKSNANGSSSKSVLVPEEIVVGSINKSPVEEIKLKPEDDVPAVVKIPRPLKDAGVVQLAPVVYHVSQKLSPATPALVAAW